jgi:hypothetical protein
MLFLLMFSGPEVELNSGILGSHSILARESSAGHLADYQYATNRLTTKLWPFPFFGVRR